MQSNDLLRDDAAARAAALDVARSFVVQAPAGSGKTELLTQRFLALLATVERPEALLAITFTRKAAAEMRNRILDALRGCSDPAAALRPETRALAQHALQADERHGWGLLDNPGRLRVLTIDALNQSLARRLPVLSGLGAGLGIAEDARRLYDEAAERLLAHLPSADPRVAEAVGVLLEHLDNNVGKLIGLVRAMLARREAWLPVLPMDLAAYGTVGEVRRVFEAARASIVRAHLEFVLVAFPRELLDELHGHAWDSACVLREAGNDESPILDCERAPPGADPGHVAQWRALREFLLTKQGTVRKSFAAGLGVLPQDKKRPELAERKRRVTEAVARLEPLAELCEALELTRDLPPPAYSDEEWRVLESLLLVLRLAAAELKLVFAARRLADYPEFAAAARAALGSELEPTDTALALDAQLRHVLVDEFQDTSEAQVRLLKALTEGWMRGDGRTLFLVGDPMQSIYRFRNAEVGLFLDVRDRGLGTVELEPLTLRVNFRSTRPIVDWVNRSFEHVLPQADDVLRGAVRYSHSVAKPSAGLEGGVTVHAFLRSSRQHEARTVADIVERRLAAFAAAGPEAAQARIAILVQGRSHLQQVVEELVRRGIAFEATQIDPLAQRPAVLDALALTQALSHLADRAAWLAVLRAPWCGLTLADCFALLGDDRHGATLKLLRDPARRARLEEGARTRLERCLVVLEDACAELRRLGLRDAVERAWHALGGPSTLANARELDEVREYFTTLGKVEAEAPGQPVDFDLLEEALSDLYTPARPHKDIRVELLTIHKAKGLQFDTVIVPGLERVGRSDDARLIEWLQLPGVADRELVIAPISAVGAEQRNPLHAWLARLENEKLLQEKRRLLYVAATRAERELHLLGSCAVAADAKTGELSLRAPNGRSALGLLWAAPSLPSAFEQRLAEAGGFEGEVAPDAPRDPRLSRLPSGWVLPPVPPGPAFESRRLSSAVAETRVEFDWASETARHVGTVVHRELQRLARRAQQGSSPLDAGSVEARLERYATELAELGVPEDRREAAAQRALAAVDRTLADARGRWLLAGGRDGETELALTGRVGTDLVRIVIDRTFVDAQGTRWIVDYKTSSHEGAGLDEFLEREQGRYREQLERYAMLARAWSPEPIRLGLYFPLLGAWREWAPAAQAESRRLERAADAELATP